MKVCLFLLFLLSSSAASAQRAHAELHCKPTKTDFIYDCTIRLARNDRPLPGVGITVGADMPSMPMAHNIRPLKAIPGKTPGEYHVRLDLEMLGEWAVKLRLGGPVKDQLILLYEFDENGAKPVKRADRTPRK